MLYTKLCVLHKLHVNSESPNFVQYSAWNREKCENFKSPKFNHNFKILKLLQNIRLRRRLFTFDTKHSHFVS